MSSPHLDSAPDGTRYRDLNGNGKMDPYEDPRLTAEERTEDLLGRLTVVEKVGMMFQTVIEMGPGGSVLETPGAISKSPTSAVIRSKLMNHFNIHRIDDARDAAKWNNAVQRLAESTPHGIPVTISTDPRHAFADNAGVGFTSGPFSQWPDGLGLAAIGDTSTTEAFARVAREEYRAVGIRAALHPQVDLATEPRWARQLQTLGAEGDAVIAHTAAYLQGFQGDQLGPTSIACTTKHFPGGGPLRDGEDAHFPYGRDQVYPAGRFDQHLAPFREAIKCGTAGIMPYYGVPRGLSLDGEPVEEVGFGFNRQVLRGLLREELQFDGVILTDWELIHDNHVGDQVLPARAWGVEDLGPPERMLKVLDAGADQFGGEEAVELLLQLVREGEVQETRLDESVRRLLLVKFQLGLFDNPFVDEDAAESVVGNREHRAAGLDAQSRSVTVLENQTLGETGILPLRGGMRVYTEGLSADAVVSRGSLVASPHEADVALVRIAAPFDPRDDLFLESYFHQGTLEFRPGLLYRLQTIARQVPLVVDVALERAAVLTPLVDLASALTVTFGVSDEAWVRALWGECAPAGRLPISLPLSAAAVRAVAEDAGLTPAQSLYSIGAGRDIPAARE